MTKRKGNLVVSPDNQNPSSYQNVSSPLLSTPYQSSNSNFSSSYNSKDDYSSHDNDEFGGTLTWKDTTEIMDELLQHIYDPDTDNTLQIQKCVAAIESFQKHDDTIRAKADALKSKIQSGIKGEEKELKEDQKNLMEHKKHLARLQTDSMELQKKNQELINRKLQAQQNTYNYKLEASQEIEKIDEVEATRVKEAPNLKHKISLYANITGIKWDFSDDNYDVLKGEVVSIKNLAVDALC